MSQHYHFAGPCPACMNLNLPVRMDDAMKEARAKRRREEQKKADAAETAYVKFQIREDELKGH